MEQQLCCLKQSKRDAQIQIYIDNLYGRKEHIKMTQSKSDGVGQTHTPTSSMDQYSEKKTRYMLTMIK